MKVSAQTMKLVGEHSVYSEVVTDQQAVKAVESFVGEYSLQLSRCTTVRETTEISTENEPFFFPLDDEKILVEPACGAALAAVYSDIIKRLQDDGRLEQQLGPVVVVVCGGNNISMEQLKRLKKQLGMI